MRTRLSVLLPVLVLGLLPSVPRAADYGVFVDIETEEDLLDLLGNSEIDEEAFETLVELLYDGVNLNTADRDELYALPNLSYHDVDAILAYRDEAGSIRDPADLVSAGALDEVLLAALAPFLMIEEPRVSMFDTRGRFRYRTTYVFGDDDVPSMWLGGRVSTFKHLDVGIIGLLTRNRLGDVVYDPNRDALVADGPSARLHLPKFYAQWETDSYHLLAGTYRIGFGQRLTFDNTSRYVPNGIRVDDAVTYNQDLTRTCRLSAGELEEGPCLGDARFLYQSPDYRWTDRLRGAAVGLKKLVVGDGWLQAYGWFSYQTRSIYQYEIVDREFCDDPRDDDDPACAAPYVFQRQDDPLAPASRFSFSTLPDMFNELVGGGNLTYFFDRRAHIGVTGYGADVSWLAEGMDLDFQEWSRLPWGGPFGAIGIDGAWGLDVVDLFLELARTFDSQPEGGGFAAILRSTATWKKHEFEAALRYYDRDYANPFARPISASDEFDGLRARDEAGLRLRYTGQAGDLWIRSGADFWAQLSDEAPKLWVKLRADYEVERWFIPGLWVEYQDKDLSSGGRRDVCYEVPIEETDEGEPVPCTGEKLQAGVQLKFMPTRRFWITAKYQHRWLDDGSDRFDTGFRQDASAWLVVMVKPTDAIRIRARARYLFEAIDHDDYLEQSLWAYLEAAYWYQNDLRVKLRYEIFAWLDDRASTEARDPNPAHWLRLELEYRFK